MDGKLYILETVCSLKNGLTESWIVKTMSLIHEVQSDSVAMSNSGHVYLG